MDAANPGLQVGGAVAVAVAAMLAGMLVAGYPQILRDLAVKYLLYDIRKDSSQEFRIVVQNQLIIAVVCLILGLNRSGYLHVTSGVTISQP